MISALDRDDKQSFSVLRPFFVVFFVLSEGAFIMNAAKSCCSFFICISQSIKDHSTAASVFVNLLPAGNQKIGNEDHRD